MDLFVQNKNLPFEQMEGRTKPSFFAEQQITVLESVFLPAKQAEEANRVVSCNMMRPDSKQPTGQCTSDCRNIICLNQVCVCKKIYQVRSDIKQDINLKENRKISLHICSVMS